jgi:hypothetical protein
MERGGATNWTGRGEDEDSEELKSGIAFSCFFAIDAVFALMWELDPWAGSSSLRGSPGVPASFVNTLAAGISK